MDKFERCDETSSIVDNAFYNQNLVPVKLMFDKSISYRVFDEFDKSEIEIDDEYLIVNTNLPSNDYLFSYLLSFGSNVELLEPYRVFDEFDKSEIEIDDEYLIVNTNLPSNDYLFSYLLSFGSNVELLEPYDLREEFKKVIKEISKKYFTL